MTSESSFGHSRAILCIGATPTVQRTMIFDALKIDAVNRAVEVIESASGKSINVARVLRTLGENVVAGGLLGGQTGRYIREELESLGITPQFIEVSPATRTCVTIVNRGDATATELVEETKPVEAAAYDALLRIVAESLPQAAAMVLSGSLPPAAPRDFYALCCRLAQQANVPTILDARGEPLRLALQEQPTLIKPNRAELEETVGFAIQCDGDLRRAIDGILARGAQYAVISMGAEGAVASDGKSLWRLGSPRVKAVNPIGSGDAMAAGLAAGIARHLPLIDIFSLGIACGAANALTPTSGVVRPEDVERLLAEVSIAAWSP